MSPEIHLTQTQVFHCHFRLVLLVSFCLHSDFGLFVHLFQALVCLMLQRHLSSLDMVPSQGEYQAWSYSLNTHIHREPPLWCAVAGSSQQGHLIIRALQKQKVRPCSSMEDHDNVPFEDIALDGEIEQHDQDFENDNDPDNDLWEMAANPVDIHDMFEEAPARSQVPERVDPGPNQPVPLSELDPATLLPKAVCWEKPELNYPMKRAREKQSVCPISVLLARVRRKPTESCQFPATRSTYSVGLNAYLAACRRVAGRISRNQQVHLHAAWKAASRDVQTNWAFIHHLWSVLYVSKPKCVGNVKQMNATYARARRPLPDGSPFPVEPEASPEAAAAVGRHGVLVTFHTTIGLSNSHTVQAIEAGVRGQQLVAVMRDIPLYLDEFSRWKEHFRKTAEELGFKSWAVSMELGASTGQETAVHLHGFMGQEVRSSACWGQCAAFKPIEIKEEDLVYRHEEPFISYMRPHGGKEIHNLACHGLYYLCMPKVGSLYRDANRWPVKDWGLQQ